MAELGRARPVVVACIGLLLTANISVLSSDHAAAKRRVAAAVARTTSSTIPVPAGRIIFGKADTVLGAPTMFSVRADGSDLEPSPLPPSQSRREQSAWSHDRSRRAIAGVDLWIVPREGDPRRLTRNATATPVGQPVWSPDDRYVAFVWGSTIVVMDAAGKRATVAYTTPTSVTEREQISLFGWADDAAADNMAV